MRKYKLIFSSFQNEDYEREFFCNTTIFVPAGEVFTIINYVYYLENKLKIKGGKNEIDVTRYSINTLVDEFGFGRRCFVLNKIYTK